MAEIKWDLTGQRFYETGIDHAVLYPQVYTNNEISYPKGVAWNGITAITESPGGAEANDMWADNIKYASIRGAETFGGTVEAYMYPDEFAQCDGSAEVAPGVSLGQQERSAFGLSYRSNEGSDIASGTDPKNGYKLHLVYNAMVTPSERGYQTINDSPEGITFSWEFDTTPIAVTGFNPTAHIEINSLKADSEKLAALEKILYGSDDLDARLPLPDEIISILKN